MMRRLIVIAMALAVIGGTAFGLYGWDTQHRFYRFSGWIKVHYLLHGEAFDRLSDKFSEDPLIESVQYDPPGSLQRIAAERRPLVDPAEQAEYDKLVEDIQAQQTRYEPLLADLKFPGSLAFHKNENDPHLTDSIGPAAEFGYALMQSSLTHADDVGTFKIPCPSKPMDLPSGDCAQHLGGDWWMRYSWSTWNPSE